MKIIKSSKTTGFEDNPNRQVNDENKQTPALLDWEFDVKDLKILHPYSSCIGISPDASDVFTSYKGIWRGAYVLVKKYDMAVPNNKRGFTVKREVEILSRLRHPHLVLFMACSTLENAPPYIILTEVCEGGSVYDLIHTKDTYIKLTLKQKTKILYDVTKGLYYLHTHMPPIVHRGLRSSSILLANPIWSENEEPYAKIADFGLARFNDKISEAMTKGVGVYEWMAPEVLKGLHYDETADVYSFGIFMYELLLESFPYSDMGLSNVQIALAVANGKRPDIKPLKERVKHSTLLEIMFSSWNDSPHERPTINSIMSKLQGIYEEMT